MNAEKLNVTLSDDVKEATLTILEGKAKEPLETRPPIETRISGTLGVPTEYLKKRSVLGQCLASDTYILVNRETMSITLVSNSTDPYNRVEVKGSLEFHKAFNDFGINGTKAWEPAELGLFLKMNRSYFKDRAENMDLVACLMNYKAEINQKVEKLIKENGSRADNYTQVVDSNLPPSFVLNMPLFKGMPNETIEVEIFAQVDGREVSFVLLSPGAITILNDIKDKVMDEEISRIIEIRDDIAILEV